MIRVRLMRAGETVPANLESGFDKAKVMPNWCWFAEENDQITGVLLAAPFHGMVYVLRMATKGSLATAALLMRAFAKDCNERGCTGYVLHLDPTREEELELMRICRKAGAKQHTMPYVMVSGLLSTAVQF